MIQRLNLGLREQAKHVCYTGGGRLLPSNGPGNGNCRDRAAPRQNFWLAEVTLILFQELTQDWLLVENDLRNLDVIGCCHFWPCSADEILSMPI